MAVREWCSWNGKGLLVLESFFIIHVVIYIHTHIHTYTYTHTYIHTFTHTYIFNLLLDLTYIMYMSFFQVVTLVLL